VELWRAVEAAGLGSAAEAEVRAAIEANESAVPVRSVEKSALQTIYRRRLSRPSFDPSLVLGVEQVLPALESLRAETVGIAVLARPGRVVSVWLDENDHALLVMAGNDNRSIPIGTRDPAR
jgi:hypothetical protein